MVDTIPPKRINSMKRPVGGGMSSKSLTENERSLLWLLAEEVPQYAFLLPFLEAQPKRPWRIVAWAGYAYTMLIAGLGGVVEL
jgi:hypothetical protein